jgi:hypothetical protein
MNQVSDVEAQVLPPRSLIVLNLREQLNEHCHIIIDETEVVDGIVEQDIGVNDGEVVTKDDHVELKYTFIAGVRDGVDGLQDTLNCVSCILIDIVFKLNDQSINP